MANPYKDFTTEQLLAEIEEYRAAIKKATLGGVGVVAGEGRRVEYVQCNVSGARAALAELETELSSRPGYEDRGNWALGVEIG